MEASAPSEVVRSFIDRLNAADTEGAMALVADDVEWRNTGLPTVRGKERVAAAFRSIDTRGITVELQTHHLAADGDFVLTDRTDVIHTGPVDTAFWVCGTFEVRDGRIVVWDDHYSAANFLYGAATGVATALGRALGRLGG